MAISRIEWTEQTWNPVTGCAKVSPGCKHCYAERMALRLQAMAAPGYDRGFDLTLHDDHLDQPSDGRSPPSISSARWRTCFTRTCPMCSSTGY